MKTSSYHPDTLPVSRDSEQESSYSIPVQKEKTGYLKEDFRLFHIKDQTEKEYFYHYHDFHKIIVFLSGKVTYHIEGDR